LASDTTPLRGRPYPAESDTPDVAADVKLLALALDKTPNVSEGTLASRPTAGAAGDRYFVTGDSTPTNNGIEWLWSGSSWRQVGGEAPIGSGDLWFGASNPSDTNWLICDGRAISRTTYATLFSVIATTYGAGDGSSTFNIPDLRQRVPLGKKATGAGGSSTNLGEKGGQIDHAHNVPGLGIPGLSIPALYIPSLQVQNHIHGLASGFACIANNASGTSFWQNLQGGKVGTFTAYSAGTWIGSAITEVQYGTWAETGSALAGTTDGAAPLTYPSGTGGGTTGGGTTGGGTTDANNPPYLTVNFVIRVS
jgi:microcystin-dependent protein